MKKEIKVLILYANYGNGHYQVSCALKKQFAVQGVTQVKLVDLFSSAHPMMDRLTRYIYSKSFSFLSSVYGWSYYLTKNMKESSPLAGRLHTYGIRALGKLINAEAPDIVINTFPMMAMSELRKKKGMNIPIYTVLTDFECHGRWLHSEVDKYFVATEDLKNVIIEQGIAPEKVEVSGIPIRDSFEAPSCPALTSEQRLLDTEKQTVLILAGASGVSSDLKKTCIELAKSGQCQLLIVCGRNRRLEQTMEACLASYEDVHVFGFVENIHHLMNASVCVVTKPGGTTLAEALRCQLPIFLLRPVPGQEKENARYLVNKGAALMPDHNKNMANMIIEWLGDKEKRQKMIEAAGKLQKQHASKTVVTHILDDFNRTINGKFAFGGPLNGIKSTWAKDSLS
ncbi:glycosyltransferase [Camelliibacillus cellulosilyticus]|uniref:Glycosyltransferase n=1 Tax=Camelliibacillus cellulosilyticus TaxID=2174486 RepID=A0ABV9GLX9_9BACL